MKDFKVGDRVKFINANFIWFGNEYVVTDYIEGIAVHVVDDRGEEFSFLTENLQVISKEPTKQTPADILQRIQDFTSKHKNLEISFGDGKMILRDFTPSFEPDEYHCDTIEQLEDLMGAWEGVSKFKVENTHG